MKKQTIQVRGIHTFPAWGYLIIGEEITAVDVGAPSVAQAMIDLVENELKRNISDIKNIVATHFHIDHVGGIHKLQRKSGAKVYLPETIRSHIEQGTSNPFPPARRWANMIYSKVDIPEPGISMQDMRSIARVASPFLNLPIPFNIEGYYGEGDYIPGGSNFRVLETPGHSNCSVCFYDENTGALISGDTLLGGRRGAEVNAFVYDRDQISQTAKSLKQMNVEILYPGHGQIINQKGLLDSMSPDPIHDGMRGFIERLKRRRRYQRDHNCLHQLVLENQEGMPLCQCHAS